MNAQLHNYQKQVGNFMIKNKKCAIFLAVGLGKTLISLAVLEKLYKHERGHILVIAPKAIARATWADEIDKWDIKIPYQSLIVNEKGKDYSKKKRLEQYQSVFRNPVRTMYFINQDLITDLVDNMPVNSNGQTIWPFSTVVIDELQNFKSSSSKRFKKLYAMSPAINRFMGLTGTPTPNSIEDIWAEMALVDNGLRLGKNITRFRQEFMLPGYRNAAGMVCSWVPKEGSEEIIYNRIKDVAVSLKNTTLKLPPLTVTEDTVYLDDKEREMYHKFKENAVLELNGETITAKNSAVMHGKLTQLASGTSYVIDDDGNSTRDYQVIHRRKLERLQYIRSNTPDNILVGYYYQSDLQEISKYLTDNNIPFEVFDSSNAQDIVRRWNAGEIPMLLAHPASAGAGLNLQNGGHTLVWYTLPASLENYEQFNGRLYRQGQTQPVIIHHILTAGTIDKPNYQRLITKSAGQQALIDAVEMALSE